jgi:hypothetical protein
MKSLSSKDAADFVDLANHGGVKNLDQLLRKRNYRKFLLELGFDPVYLYKRLIKFNGDKLESAVNNYNSTSNIDMLVTELNAAVVVPESKESSEKSFSPRPRKQKNDLETININFEFFKSKINDIFKFLLHLTKVDRNEVFDALFYGGEAELMVVLDSIKTKRVYKGKKQVACNGEVTVFYI